MQKPKPFVLFPITVDEPTVLTDTANNVFYVTNTLNLTLAPLSICINGFVVIVSSIATGTVTITAASDDGGGTIAIIDAGASIMLVANSILNLWDTAMSNGSGGGGSVQGLAISDASDGASAIGDNAVAVGNLSMANGDGTVAIGGCSGTPETNGALAVSDASIAIGGNSSTGNGAQAMAQGAIAIGGGINNTSGALATGVNSIAIGANDDSNKGVFADNAIAIGYGATVESGSDNSIVIGPASTNTISTITLSTNGLTNTYAGSIMMGTFSETFRVNHPAHSNVVYKQITTNVDSPTATHILGGVITLPTATSVTLPTAADIDLVVPNPYIGMTFDCLFIPAIANALTINGNTNTTISGLAVGATGQALMVKFYRSANTPAWRAFVY